MTNISVTTGAPRPAFDGFDSGCLQGIDGATDRDLSRLDRGFPVLDFGGKKVPSIALLSGGQKSELGRDRQDAVSSPRLFSGNGGGSRELNC
jgi:hypothetical protein